MNDRKKLSDILHGDREKVAKLWNNTNAAAEFAPIPRGEYTFRVLAGELFTSKSKGTPGYKLTLEVTQGDFEGRRVWCDLWLTPAALPLTKRDLIKLGITNLEQLEQPLPAGILVRGKLVVRRDDDGNESNRLVRFECAGVEPGDAFEPKDGDADQDNGQTPTRTAPEEPFAFGANATPSANGAGNPEGATP